MKKLISLIAVLAILLPACAWWNSTAKPELSKVSTAAAYCAKAEATAAGSNLDVIKGAEDVVATITAIAAAISTGNLATLWAALAPYVTQYGEPFVSCVVRDVAGLDAGSGSGSAGPVTAALPPTALLARQLIEVRGWSYGQ